jgi:hypothetical protein
MTGRQLLLNGGAAWLTNAIAFGLAYWEIALEVAQLSRRLDADT